MRKELLALVVGWTLILFTAPLVLMLIVGLILSGVIVTLKAYLFPCILSISVGLGLLRMGNKNDEHGSERLRDKEAFAAVALGWPIVVAIGALPFWLGGMFHGPWELIAGTSTLHEVLGGYVRAWFESMSGFTTTGATVIDPRTSPVCQTEIPDCINGQEKTLLLWRSMTQWLGGMGIIMLGMLLLARYLGGGMSIARAELTGPSLSRLRPRIQHTAIVLWTIYTLLTLIEIILLLSFTDMGYFDAINHGLTTLPTGGFSTYDSGVMYFDDPVVEWILIVFMVAAGVNFSLYHFMIEKEWKDVWNDQELRVYLSLLFVAMIAITINLIAYADWDLFESIRHAAFQAASIGTSTGYASTDFAIWPTLSLIILLFMMIVGASAGSTGGGLKILRLRIAYLLAKREISRIASPKKIHLVRLNNEVVPDDKLWTIVGMLSWWAVLAMSSIIMLAIIEPSLDLQTVISVAISSLGNTGPALGSLGPTQTWASLNWVSLIITSGLMWLGRLELLTVIVLVSLRVWKK
ncbi:MAG: TrkH family potassium uptake protein [Candidatus Thalassarchaeaceae archaeon]|jgi:trk system potassium uptake protein TrkH|nr:TrkH family potassium uptake protein [Candidatus Thalassarchaeaceae archaeon]